MNIIAFDPGLMTGVAVWEEGHAQPVSMQFTIEELYEFLDGKFNPALQDWEFVCEAYVISEQTLKKSRQAWSLEIIGVVKFLAWLRKQPLKMQQASSAKSFVTNARLKEIGWYTPGRDHANDAMRHMFLYCVQKKIITSFT